MKIENIGLSEYSCNKLKDILEYHCIPVEVLFDYFIQNEWNCIYGNKEFKDKLNIIRDIVGENGKVEKPYQMIFRIRKVVFDNEIRKI